MDEKLTDVQIENILYMIARRAGKSDDELDYEVLGLLDHYIARIVELEAQVKALTEVKS